MSTTSSSPKLERGLSNRHIQLIAIGGAIGTGLFYGSASTISLTGPAIILSYFIGGIIVFLIMRMLGEMCVQHPISGSFSSYAEKFWGEFPAILAAYQPAPGINLVLFRTLMVVAALGTVLAAGYLLWLFQRTSFGVPTDEFEKDPAIEDVKMTEWIAWTPMIVMIVVLGFVPGLIMNITNPAAGALAAAFGVGG